MPRDGHEITAQTKRSDGGEDQVSCDTHSSAVLSPASIKPRARLNPEIVARIEVPWRHFNGRRTTIEATPSQAPSSSLHPSTIVEQLVKMQRRRQFYIKSCLTNRSMRDHLLAGELGHLVKNALGTNTTYERTKKEAFAIVDSFCTAVVKGSDLSTFEAYPDLLERADFVVECEGAYEMLQSQRLKTEADMCELAAQLPLASFVAEVRGLSLKGLAVLQAIARDPFAEYRTISGLWKRFGVAVIDGGRQRGIAGKRETLEDQVKYAYSATNRAELWSVADIMLRAQWRGERLQCVTCDKLTKPEHKSGLVCCDVCKTECTADALVPAHALGPYGEVYACRKAHTASKIIETAHLAKDDARKWTPARCDNDAKRIMSKALLLDIWKVSRGLAPRGRVPI